ncbi:MAG TPA: serine/threonine-protein kinase, partial [Ktedonobacteraceae bacterium]|nr:serine/threonine-protein kinase [Ktedonobacteraceae bacterium]
MLDRAGQQLGNYRLLSLLGQGGFAEVYLGEHVFLKKSVAVKLLYTQLGKDDLEGFLKEAQTIAHLEHPHIVRVTDFGLDNNLPYLVMEYAPNGTLRHRHPRGTTLPLTTISSYIKQVADALQYAHDEKLVHRDIKPENMLLNRNNNILLSDFGLATVAHHTATQNTQSIAGTAVYMAPEMFRGKSYPASDQYALGIIVYEWITGQPPFNEGDFIQLGFQHTYVPPEPLSEKIPGLPKDVEHIVMTALAKDPKQRFGSVKAFANAFEQACKMAMTQ